MIIKNTRLAKAVMHDLGRTFQMCLYVVADTYHSNIKSQLYCFSIKKHSSLWISGNLTRQNQAFYSLSKQSALYLHGYNLLFTRLTYPISVGKREFLATELIMGT